MAATAAPYGAEPVGTLSSSGSFSGKMRQYPIAASYATQISYGDFVKCVNDGTIDRSVITTTLDTGTIGIFMGCEYTDPTTNQKTFSQYWPASNAATDAKAFVADDPFLLFKMQADGTIAATGLFNNVSCVDGAGDTVHGRSRNAIDADTIATTNTLPLRIVELIDDPAGNAYRECIVTWLPGGHALLAPLGV